MLTEVIFILFFRVASIASQQEPGIIKAALNLDFGRHQTLFIPWDLKNLVLTFTKDFVLTHMVKEHGQKSIGKIHKLEDGIYKQRIYSWLTEIKILGNGQAYWTAEKELLLVKLFVMIVDTFLNFTLLLFQILLN